MNDQYTQSGAGRPAGGEGAAWVPPADSNGGAPPPPGVAGAPYPSAPPGPWPPAATGSTGAPTTPWFPAAPPAGGVPQPPTQQAWAPPPPAGGFSPTPAGRGSWAGYRRGGIRGNGIYSVVAGVISLLVALVSLAMGHFTFLVFLPVLGLIYGIVSIRQGNRRVLGIIGTVLCGLALLVEAVLLLG